MASGTESQGLLWFSGHGDHVDGVGPVLCVADGAGPEPSARRRPGQVAISASGGVLAIPDDAHPAVTVFQHPDGRWVVERDGQEDEVFDGDVVPIDGEAWMLHLPRVHVATQEARATSVDFTFAVTTDEEDVEIRLQIAGVETTLRARSHYYTLLTLARARVADEGRSPRAGGAASPSCARPSGATRTSSTSTSSGVARSSGARGSPAPPRSSNVAGPRASCGSDRTLRRSSPGIAAP